MAHDHNDRGRGDDEHGYQGGMRSERWQQEQADQGPRVGYGEQGGRQQRGESFSRDFSQGGQQGGNWDRSGAGEGRDHPDRWSREEMNERKRAFRERSGNESNAYGGRDEASNRVGPQDQGYRGYEDSGRWTSGRSYGGGDRGRSEGGRDFWDKATDEVSSWFGDDDAKNRRNMDEHRGRGPKSYSRSDDRIKEDINDRLTDDGALDATDIDVEVSSREVTLTGEVDSRNSKRRAEDIAEAVSGVSHVQNNLRVKQIDQIRPIGSSTASTAGAAASTTLRNRL